MAPQKSINLQPIYDQILQETFTDSETNNGRTSPRSRSLQLPLFENLNRPPHITLFWCQSLDGTLIPECDNVALNELASKLEEAHQATLLTSESEVKGGSKRVLVNPGRPSQADIIYTTLVDVPHQTKHLHFLQEQDSLLPQIFRHLVREHHIKTLLLKPDTNEALTTFINSKQVDKVVIIQQPELLGGKSMEDQIKRLPFKLSNVHYETIENSIVITGEPQHNS